MSPETVWINTTDYSTLELIFFALGCLGWVVAYMGTLAVIRKRQFVEIPAAAVAANIAWEFVWGFFYTTNMGMLFQWGYRAWFFLDVFIVYSLFKYGGKQVVSPVLRKYFAPFLVFGILSWAIGLYFFVGEGYDNSTGAISGYILNVMMSAIYIMLLLNHADARDFSLTVAWSKMLGTALITVFCFLVLSHMRFLLTMAIVTFILDIVYIAALTRRLRQR